MANLLQTQPLRFLHDDYQSSACLIPQAHLVLETSPSFRLILRWTRLPIDTVAKPYYCETKIQMSERLFTAPLLGHVLVPSARALPPTTGKASMLISMMA